MMQAWTADAGQTGKAGECLGKAGECTTAPGVDQEATHRRKRWGMTQRIQRAPQHNTNIRSFGVASRDDITEKTRSNFYPNITLRP